MNIILLLALSLAPCLAFGRDLMPLPAANEIRRVAIENRVGGEIRGSVDGGSTWVTLGRVIAPAVSAAWRPTVDYNAMAFDYLRGPSTVFAAGVDILHIKLSDPAGYALPEDVTVRPVPAHGISVLPLEKGFHFSPESDRLHSVITDIPGGTGIFGSEWNTRAGADVYYGTTEAFRPIPYEIGEGDAPLLGATILTITHGFEREVEWVEFENQVGGRISVKRAGEEPMHVAKVLQPVSGIGRFAGTEFIQIPGNLRVNTGGVMCIGTTDANVDPSVAHPIAEGDILGMRGGFQIVPSHHWNDEQMLEAHSHPEVYLIVGPIADPVDLVRYDRGIEATYPLFHRGLQPGTGRTYFKFRGDERWHELSDAQREGRFKTVDGSVVPHLRGYIREALSEVTAIRYVAQE